MNDSWSPAVIRGCMSKWPASRCEGSICETVNNLQDYWRKRGIHPLVTTLENISRAWLKSIPKDGAVQAFDKMKDSLVVQNGLRNVYYKLDLPRVLDRHFGFTYCCWVVRIENDLQVQLLEYTTTKLALTALEHRSQGNLVTCSMSNVVEAIREVDFKYLTTLYIVLRSFSVHELLGCYVNLSEHVVPRSASFASSDNEYSIYSVSQSR